MLESFLLSVNSRTTTLLISKQKTLIFVYNTDLSFLNLSTNTIKSGIYSFDEYNKELVSEDDWEYDDYAPHQKVVFPKPPVDAYIDAFDIPYSRFMNGVDIGGKCTRNGFLFNLSYSAHPKISSISYGHLTLTKDGIDLKLKCNMNWFCEQIDRAAKYTRGHNTRFKTVRISPSLRNIKLSILNSSGRLLAIIFKYDAFSN